MTHHILRKAALAHIKDRKLLMVRDFTRPEVFLTLGGKIEEGETDVECLHREVLEEVGCKIEPGSVKFLGEFEAPAHNKPDVIVNIRLFAGELASEPTPSSEVVELKYVDSSVEKKYLEGNIVGHQIVAWLKQHDLIN